MFSVRKYINDPGLMWLSLSGLGLFKWMPDKLFLSLEYRIRMKKKLNIESPESFNEKLQWLKLYDRKAEYTDMADKYAAKEYLSEIVGVEHIIPTLGVWERFEDIDFDTLPDRFVLKCTHDSGGVIPVKDKSKMDLGQVKRRIERCLKRNYYNVALEWPYKNIRPRIIAEEYLDDGSGTELNDYKVFNFNGKPRLIQVDRDRFTRHRRNIYDTEWNYQNIRYQYDPTEDHMMDKPESLDMILQLARKLSKGIPFVRTDFYCVGKNVYVGELTFYPEAGFGRFEPEEWDLILGRWLEIDRLENTID